MKLDLGSFAFGSTITTGGGTPSWGTALGQGKGLKFSYPGWDNIMAGMLYKTIPTSKIFMPIGKGGHVYNGLEDEGIQFAALFDVVYINEVRVNAPFVMVVYRDSSTSWAGRRTLKYSDKIEYHENSSTIIKNSDFIIAAREALQLEEDACWIVSDIYIEDQETLHLFAGIVDAYGSQSFSSPDERKSAWLESIKNTLSESSIYKRYCEGLTIQNNYSLDMNNTNQSLQQLSSDYRPYITAIKSKPFLLLAGISGTGKSRIVRELARACWDADSEEYKAHKPSNFEMVQVKPNWHDSSELIGYVSRVSGEPVYVAGPFLKFVAKAWENPDVPYFLCLDEMNLAPVEQYFAEYLSVVESRKAEDGIVKTDPILDKVPQQWYFDLVGSLTEIGEVQDRFKKDGICIPQNLIVVGTVNMDETTFSFSRKVLDRAMTIEMNEVNLTCGLDKRHETIGKLDKSHLIGTAVEGCDVYNAYKADCDTAIAYLNAINQHLEKTPFKVAYRTRNEFLLYVVNNLPYNKDEDGKDVQHGWLLARALDEITCMKVLSRIEGDETKVRKEFLSELTKEIKTQLESLGECIYTADRAEENKENNVWYSKSLDKLNEMTKRLESGYTSFWS